MEVGSINVLREPREKVPDMELITGIDLVINKLLIKIGRGDTPD